MIASSSLDYGAALFSHELGDIVGPAATLAGGAGAFPAAEGLSAGPCAGGCSGAFIGVADTSFYLIKEAGHLGLVAREDTGSETVVDPVGFGDRLVQASYLTDGHKGHEQLFLEKRAVQR